MSDRTLDPRDEPKRRTQLQEVRDLLTDPLGRWWTLQSIGLWVHGSEAAISARVRDLRKPQHGGYTVERRRMETGVYQYRAVTKGGAYQLGLL